MIIANIQTLYIVPSSPGIADYPHSLPLVVDPGPESARPGIWRSAMGLLRRG